MAQTWQYSPATARAFFGPVDLISSADPTAGVTIEPVSPVWREVRGCDGEVVRVRASYFSARVTVSIAASSEEHTRLTGLAIADAVTGAGALPFSFADAAAGIAYVSPVAYLDGIAPVTYASGAPFALWTILCPFMAPAALPVHPGALESL